MAGWSAAEMPRLGICPLRLWWHNGRIVGTKIMYNLSIYLLKSELASSDVIKSDAHTHTVSCAGLTDATVYLCDTTAHRPWWIHYLGLDEQVSQQMQGALLIVKVGDVSFAITFGQGYRLLNDFAYEYDFGLITSLNAIDPVKLKSVDSVQPTDAKRRRVQMPRDSKLDVFDVLRNESVLNRMSGLVRTEYANLFKTITGSCNARIATKTEVSQLPDLCAKLLDLYRSENYKTAFPALRNISPIRDPGLIKYLDSHLCGALHNHDESVALSIPEVIDYGQFSGVRFDAGRIYSMVVVDSMWESFGDSISSVTVERLRRHHQMALVDEEGSAIHGPYSLYKCLVWDCELDEKVYHLCDGLWYQIDAHYLQNLNRDIHNLFEDTSFPNNNKDCEADYNKLVAESGLGYLCLDKDLIYLDEGSIEPCDLFRVYEGKAEFVHVKIGVVSSRLSHLFNQGGNSIEMLLSDSNARDLFKQKIAEYGEDYITAIRNRESKIIFLIITNKNPIHKEKNIPLFSRISLRRMARMLDGMGVEVSVQFVKDEKVNSAKAKKRRARSSVSSPQS